MWYFVPYNSLILTLNKPRENVLRDLYYFWANASEIWRIYFTIRSLQQFLKKKNEFSNQSKMLQKY